MKLKRFNETIDFDDEDFEEHDLPDFNFREIDKPKKDELYLELGFEGGDADTKHTEYHKFNFKFSEYKENLEEVHGTINNYKKLSKILDINNQDYCENYQDVLKNFGDETARLYDNTPNDPQSDYQYKCYLGVLKLIGYDKSGNKHESYIR